MRLLVVDQLMKRTSRIDRTAQPFALSPPTTSIVAAAVGVVGFCLLTILGAKIRVPLPGTPIPMTLQTAVVLFSGLALGARLGAASQVLYLLLGLIGLPVFAGSDAGWQYVFGATGGYLLAFPLVTVVVGLLTRRSAGVFGTIGAVACGTLLIFTLGVGWLVVLEGQASTALGHGLTPFLAGAVVKGGLATSLGYVLGPACRKVWRSAAVQPEAS